MHRKTRNVCDSNPKAGYFDKKAKGRVRVIHAMAMRVRSSSAGEDAWSRGGGTTPGYLR